MAWIATQAFGETRQQFIDEGHPPDAWYVALRGDRHSDWQDLVIEDWFARKVDAEMAIRGVREVVGEPTVEEALAMVGTIDRDKLRKKMIESLAW